MAHRLPSVSLLLGWLLTLGLGAAAQTQNTPRPDSNASRREARVLASNIRAEVRAPLNDAQLAIALRVHSGRLPCELGQEVLLAPDSAAAGHFSLVYAKVTYRVSPQETTTGAIRLEDKAAGVVWLQLANKSMLMSQKLGRRLADGCKGPDQEKIAQAMLVNPPPSLLDNAVPVGDKLATKP